MAYLLGNLRSALTVAAATLCTWAPASMAQVALGPERTALIARPTLAVDLGVHIGTVNDVATDEAGSLIATASADRTVRVWDTADGTLRRTFRPPVGEGNIGMMYAVAFQPKSGLLAAGGFTNGDDGYPIYLLNIRAGSLARRVTGMPNVTTRVAFSSDGRFLAAGTAGAVKVFDRDLDWKSIYSDRVQGTVYGLEFTRDGRLVAVTDEGMARLYGPDHRMIATRNWPAQRRPPFLAISPDGGTIAVGNLVNNRIALLNGSSLADDDLDVGTSGGNVNAVAWSTDGARLFVGRGLSVSLTGDSIDACGDRGRGACEDYDRGIVDGSLTGMVTLPGGRLAVAGGGRPFVGVIKGPAEPAWFKQSSTTSNQNLTPLIRLSASGQAIEFRFEASNQVFAFDPTKADSLSATKTDLPSTLGVNRLSGLGPDLSRPVFNGHPLEVQSNETILARYIFADSGRLVLGTTDELYSYSDQGRLLWRRFTPEQVRSVLGSQDGKLLVTALGDGTIRWYDAETGNLLCSFLVFASPSNFKRFEQRDVGNLAWVVWTPDGFYNSSASARDSLQWWVMGGPNDLTTALPVSSLPLFRRPDLFAPLLASRNPVQALGEAEHRVSQQALQAAIGSTAAPGARLHVLAVGIKDYGPAAKRLTLAYADRDAHDLAEALIRYQKADGASNGGLYAEVIPTFLSNERATDTAINDAFDNVATLMRGGGGQDVAVVMFSGHGFLINDDFYLIPYGVDASSSRSVEKSAISIDRFRKWVGRLAAGGQVIVLLDACHSGAATSDGTALTPKADALREIAPDQTTILLTSSRGNETSAEDPKWGHGAFTKVLLEQLKPEAGRTMVRMNMANFANSTDDKLVLLTKNKQHMSKQIPPAAGLRQLLTAVP